MSTLPAEQLDAEIARALRTNQDELAIELLRLKLASAERSASTAHDPRRVRSQNRCHPRR